MLHKNLKILFAIGIAGLIALDAWLRPIYNWDVIGYVAAIKQALGAEGPVLLDATFADIREVVDKDKFEALTTGGIYRSTVFSDPEALRQHIPFYAIRPGYLFLVFVASSLTDNITSATVIVGALASFLFVLASFSILLRGLPERQSYIAMLLFPIILWSSGISKVAGLSTPDMTAAVAGIFALSTFNRNRILAFLVCALAVTLRTDFIILVLLLIFAMFVQRERRFLHYIVALLPFVVYLTIRNFVIGYEHFALFEFTFMERTPYPESIVVSYDFRGYFDVFLSRVWILLDGSLAVIAVFVIISFFRRRIDVGQVKESEEFLAVVAMSYVVLHFIFFPLGADRHYIFSYLFASIVVMRGILLSTRASL